MVPKINIDIKADNIMFSIADDSVFDDFMEKELQTPCPRKEVDGRIIYTSRGLKLPKELNAPVLCDLGSAVPGDIEQSKDIQPDIYRAPEVILGVHGRDFSAQDLVKDQILLEQRETTLQGLDKASFLSLMQKMLQWEPAKRGSAKELAEHEWIRKSMGD
ncbi:unnamed protein product [Parascedosporium putredinis]|uniref:Protein kinase domain-containing protein n=1 Tax=Parascedosporium putredinis TaxID=1442378 RepID=A0A9P1MC80_9PEZI|nr:unnamed protein product [Parascedosporium putredinis]CAI7997361.1 unnamed protein product [Parascedosporium putredinis]